MVELSGALRSKELLAIMQWLGDLHPTGSLEVARDGWSARLEFRDGRVVAASFADERGLDILTSFGHLSDNAAFRYTEDAASALPRAGVQPTTMALGDLPTATVACPKLGFVDDSASHFERPTAVHRCFATGTGQRVSAQQQAEFCLSGGYRGCPRLQGVVGAAPRNGSAAQSPMPRLPAAGVATASDARGDGDNPGLLDRFLPPVSIVLAIAALAAVFVVFVRPLLVATESTTAPPVTDAVATPVPVVEQIQPAVEPTPVAALTLSGAPTPVAAPSLGAT